MSIIFRKRRRRKKKALKHVEPHEREGGRGKR